MTSNAQAIQAHLARAPVVPLVKANDPDTAIAITRALVSGGLNVIEVILRTENALNCLAAVAENVTEAIVGAGTVLSPGQARESLDAGAQFLVCPGFDPSVVRVAQDADRPIYPGVSTSSEVQQAWNMGLDVLKFFPASQCGGPPMLKAIGAAFSGIQFIPTGGISAANLGDYLALPNVLACGGSWLTPGNAVESGAFDQITKLAAEAVAIGNELRK